jgi:periplasmic protein TonB
MAYTDTQSSVQPGGIAIATLINGAALLGLVFAAPEIVDRIRDTPIIIETIPPDPITSPPTDPVKTKKAETKASPTPDLSRATRVEGSTIINTTAQPTDAGGTDLIKSVEPPSDPGPVAHVPIVKAPRLDPRYASALQPDYPGSMIRAEQEGSVSVRVLIGTDGKVKQVEVMSAASEDFAEATKRQALKKWRFIPGTSDGEPTESWRTMTVRFEIPE